MTGTETMQVVIQPAFQFREITVHEIFLHPRNISGCRLEKLGTKNISDRISLKTSANCSALPMNILHASVFEVRDLYAKIRSVAGVPCLWQVSDGEISLEHLAL